nr:CshA/CshB family fibrillar adhesin-related protein [Nocardioides sp. TF02-7]
MDWFEWGGPREAIPAGGLTRTNEREVAGGTLRTTCTIGAVSGGDLIAYRPGNWGGDALDDLYRIGEPGNLNQLISGLANAVDGTTISFPLSCSATLGGAPVPLAGLVMADAEQSGGDEYVEATIPAGAQWRMIDRLRTDGCISDTTVTRTGQTLRLTGPAAVCPTGPAGVAFMEDATSAEVTLQGGGVSAIALGVMLFNDFGDAPETYGAAGALYSPGFTGGPVPQGDSSLFGSTLNTPTQPATRLGATVDSEGAHQPSAAADADGSDENAITPPARIAGRPGTTYTLPRRRVHRPGERRGLDRLGR